MTATSWGKGCNILPAVVLFTPVQVCLPEWATGACVHCHRMARSSYDDVVVISGAVSSQLSTLVMEHSKQTAIPLSTSLASPQEGASLTQGIPIFPIGVATQPLTLAQTLPVSTMPPGESAGKPLVLYNNSFIKLLSYNCDPEYYINVHSFTAEQILWCVF